MIRLHHNKICSCQVIAAMHFLHSLCRGMHFVTQAMHFMQIVLRGSKTALRVPKRFSGTLGHKKRFTPKIDPLYSLYIPRDRF